ncbi:uncharacterized protein LOC143568949 [Bidens hawaiensis]|uniref:uncharacterized protein LOC143568949 n=1 Tax=Bidens hawaiensis TaxID=980011 RepID=UPI00404933F3
MFGFSLHVRCDIVYRPPLFSIDYRSHCPLLLGLILEPRLTVVWWRAQGFDVKPQIIGDCGGMSPMFHLNFLKIAVPFNSLTHKDKPYEWGPQEDEAFQTLKQKLCDEPILALPDGNDDFALY